MNQNATFGNRACGARRRGSAALPGAFGIMAMFETHQELVNAAQRAYAEGYRKMDAYSPFPIDGLAKALGRGYTAVPFLVLFGGSIGCLGGYIMQWFAMGIDYPLNVGGRPLHSWPQFIPITFELTVLLASLTAFVSVLVLNRFPQPYHPVFNVPEFSRATRDRFFLCIEARDPKFEPAKVAEFLESLGPAAVTNVLE